MAKAETIRRGKLGKLELRLVSSESKFFGLADGKILLEGDDADHVWQRLHSEAGKSDPKYFGYSGARARFLYWFAGGFQSTEYLTLERSYKLQARDKLESISVEQAASGSGYGPAIWRVFQTNLLSPFEKMRVREALHSQEADEFVRGAARFALGEGKLALRQMESALKPHLAAKWTVATYLPFLWLPQHHMYLKPEATKDFAARVGHRFANEYEPALVMEVYDSLLDLAKETARELAELEPRDRIDVQSFIWIVGDYREGREDRHL